MYALHPGRRDELIRLFEREFIEAQEAVGIQVIGQFYDLDDPNQVVWLRGFNDMTAREGSLRAFYDGPVWKTHRDAANATMIDSDNVLLLRLASQTSGFSLKNGERPPRGVRVVRDGFIVGTIYYLNKPATAEFVSYFENTIKPELIKSGGSVLAYFVTEDSPNTFPRLSVRTGENIFVWFTGFPDQESYKSHLAKLRESKHWNEATKFLQGHIQGKPEILRLTPTPRSWLTGRSNPESHL